MRLAPPEASGTSGTSGTWGAGAAPPAEVVLVVYPGPGAVEALFAPPDDRRGASEDVAAWREDPDEALFAEVARGELAWDRWHADHVVVRAFEEGGTWRDSVRVNLSRAGRWLVLFGHWPLEVEADPEALRPLARALTAAPS